MMIVYEIKDILSAHEWMRRDGIRPVGKDDAERAKYHREAHGMPEPKPAKEES